MYVYYSLDREGFIEKLCENKDKPELNCNGKCMLAQMLRAQAEDDEPMPLIGWEEVLVFFMDLPVYNVPTDGKETHTAFHYKNSYSYHFNDTLIKPPMI
ncbi:hypothetical protein PY092_02955 [Muricauda sp. 334s03]|uniref:Uncharacterized protein n=2 Tax=Flagellimonas yonaguniensis TaxID=3031325 RepID=A0ABT5XV89_9FLAO|nr:hypothetical protein [[Muricauda] yonaguniensis]